MHSPEIIKNEAWEPGGCSHKFQIGMCCEGSLTLTLVKDEDWAPFKVTFYSFNN